MNIEQEIVAKGLTAPRVTPMQIEGTIIAEHFFSAAEGLGGACDGYKLLNPVNGGLHLLTFCVLVLQNGFTVTGESACASPENFDADIGRKIARTNAVNKIWPLLGFRLRDQFAYNPRNLHRDAATGKLVTEDYAAANPSTTVREVR